MELNGIIVSHILLLLSLPICVSNEMAFKMLSNRDDASSVAKVNYRITNFNDSLTVNSQVALEESHLHWKYVEK